jgi:dTDP-4-amino-4,6-dideoxygalactose transaminase
VIPIANPEFGEAEKQAVLDVMESGRFTDGPTVRKFEAEFAEFCGATHGVATTNGTTALQTAFEALDIGAGDTVVTSPFSFIASANAVRFAGARPVFADIDLATYNIDPHSTEELIEEYDADAILAVHLFGLPAEMTVLREIADEHDCALIEDAAQAHGAAVENSRVGTLGDAACFSFYPTKNMTTGEGGMVTTDRAEVAENAASFVNHGRVPDRPAYEHTKTGHNFRMTSLLAAIGRVQLERLPAYNESRRTNAARLTEALSELDGIETPVEPADRRHVYHQYTIRHGERDALLDHLEGSGVGAGIYYPRPIHFQPPYADGEATSKGATDAPAAEYAAESVLSLPVHPGLEREDVEAVIDAVHNYGGSR